MKTAEAVSPKHPDKMCDQISDAIVDYALSIDPSARVAVEVLGGHGRVCIVGEMTIKNGPPTDLLDQVLHKIVEEVTGRKDLQLNWEIPGQSAEIAQGVDPGGAGDQGIMVGYACNDNEAMIPQETWLARNLCQTIYSEFPFDGKTQVTIDKNKVITAVVASFQNTTKKQLREIIDRWLIDKDWDPKMEIHCNAAGDWKVGGFEADTGLTGRKLTVDNYGPQIPVGGGCFSGKDSTKVDRSGAYMARNVAVSMLKKLNAKEVIVKIAYAIGVADPVMFTIEADGDTYDMQEMEKRFGIRWQLQPKEIIEYLGLKVPQFQKTAEWGHFGNGFKWDKGR